MIKRMLSRRGQRTAAVQRAVAALEGAPAGMERRESGLVVPRELAKDRRAFPRSDWRHVARALEAMRQNAVVMILVCSACGERVAPRRTPAGVAQLECKCRVREVV